MKPFVAEGLELRERTRAREPEEAGTGPLRYELYGICVHQGSTMASGHYVAYVNSGASLEREAWFGISDTRVWSCSRAEVLKAEAYIAFYRREGSGEALEAARVAALADAAEAEADEAQAKEAEEPGEPSEGAALDGGE